LHACRKDQQTKGSGRYTATKGHFYCSGAKRTTESQRTSDLV
jgi:hypothetical protein